MGRSKDAQPAYLRDLCDSHSLTASIPPRLAKAVTKDRTMAEIIVVAPQKLEQKMVFVNADEMKRSIADTGKVALYGLYFDTDKDTMRADSAPTMEEIAKLMRANPQMKLRVVGHTDNQGATAYNLDLSKRRAAGVAQQLVSRADGGVAAGLLWSGSVFTGDIQPDRGRAGQKQAGGTGRMVEGRGASRAMYRHSASRIPTAHTGKNHTPGNSHPRKRRTHSRTTRSFGSIRGSWRTTVG